MAILPDDIKDITEMNDSEKINTIFIYCNLTKLSIIYNCNVLSIV